MLFADEMRCEKSSFFLLSWFGTLVSSQARYDWLEHRALSRDKTSNSLLFLSIRNELSSSFQLLKRHSAPRALPSVSIIRLEDRHVALRCVKSADSQDIVDHLLTAIPGGSMEINRKNISHWEKFLLLSPDQLNGLYNILHCRVIRTTTKGEYRLSISKGFIIQAGDVTFDLADLQNRRLLETFTRTNVLADTNGTETEFHCIEDNQ